jgi:virginiamycin B lyase
MYLKKRQSEHTPYFGIFGRVVLSLLFILASTLLVWGILSVQHSSAHAAPAVRETIVPGADPWGITFDNSNVWIAEPGCDPPPTCTPQIPSAIAQYNRQSFSLVQNFTTPVGFSAPFFLASDTQGHIWFTEPASNAIGELSVSNGSPSWLQWTVPTASATPYDLAFDSAGHLWFTEFGASQIGEFTPASQQFVEMPTPTANSNPYGIVGPDPTGSMWFTENNNAVSQIGRFTPPTSGTLSSNSINEYLTKNRVNSTPHLLTFDKQGNIWWTEGFNDAIGSLAIKQASPGTSNGVTEYTLPAPACTLGPSCSMHTSGIGVDSKGIVWFDDSLSSRIGSLDPATGNFSMMVIGSGPTSNTHPHDGFAIDKSDNAWFGEEFANKLGEVFQWICNTNQSGPIFSQISCRRQL